MGVGRPSTIDNLLGLETRSTALTPPGNGSTITEYGNGAQWNTARQSVTQQCQAMPQDGLRLVLMV